MGCRDGDATIIPAEFYMCLGLWSNSLSQNTIWEAREQTVRSRWKSEECCRNSSRQRKKKSEVRNSLGWGHLRMFQKYIFKVTANFSPPARWLVMKAENVTLIFISSLLAHTVLFKCISIMLPLTEGRETFIGFDKAQIWHFSQGKTKVSPRPPETGDHALHWSCHHSGGSPLKAEVAVSPPE